MNAQSWIQLAAVQLVTMIVAVLSIQRSTIGVALADSPSRSQSHEFRFVDVCVAVRDAEGSPVEGASVKLYSTEWSLLYPHVDAFGRTGGAGTCGFRVPAGSWTIMAGGGTASNSARSGRGLFLVKRVMLEMGQTVTLAPAPRYKFSLHFLGRTGEPSELDAIYAAPATMVPNCLMPDIGTTAGGVCDIEVNGKDPLSLFLVGKPAANRPGYFIFLDRQSPSRLIRCHAGAIPLKQIQFDGRGADDGPGPVEWVFCFPSLDTDRHFDPTKATISPWLCCWALVHGRVARRTSAGWHMPTATAGSVPKT